MKEYINSILDYDITGKELQKRLTRIKNNFYSNYGAAIAEEAVRLYDKTFELELTHSFLTIAHDIEIEWRNKSTDRTLLKTLSNPYSIELIPFSAIDNMNVKMELYLRQELSPLIYSEFLSTPYWKSVASFLKHIRKHCELCDSTEELEVHHTTYKAFPRGLEHRNLDKLQVVCKLHHLEIHMHEKDTT
jgi:hypothetical protein